MPITISTNPAAISAQRQLNIARKKTEHALEALSSGSRIVHAGDDSAAFAIGEELRAQMSGLKQAKVNASNAGSLIQVAEGSLNEQNNILIRLRELAVESASDTVSDKERGYLNEEFGQLTHEFDRIAQNTRFGEQYLLRGDEKQLQFQVGAYHDDNNVISYHLDADTRASTVGVEGLAVDDQDSAQDSIDSIDEAIDKINGLRANFGAIQERLQYATQHADMSYENIAEARSRLVDADVAEESTKLVQGQILQDVGTSVLAQANQAPERVLKLIS